MSNRDIEFTESSKRMIEHIRTNKEKIKELEKQKKGLESYLEKIDKKILFLKSQRKDHIENSLDKNFETLQNVVEKVRMKIRGINESIKLYKKVNKILDGYEDLKSPLREVDRRIMRSFDASKVREMEEKYKKLNDLISLAKSLETEQHLNLDESEEITSDETQEIDNNHDKEEFNKLDKLPKRTFEYIKYPINDKEYISIKSIKDMKKLNKIRLRIIKDVGALLSKECCEDIISQVLREEFKDKIHKIE